MSKRPREDKPSAEAIGKAMREARLSLSEQPGDHEADDGKNPAAKSLGSRGGKARAKALDAKRRSEIAERAAAARWKRR
jgi:hypothetical protein